MYLIWVCQFCNKIINGFMYYLIILGNDFGIKKKFTRLNFKSMCIHYTSFIQVRSLQWHGYIGILVTFSPILPWIKTSPYIFWNSILKLYTGGHVSNFQTHSTNERSSTGEEEKKRENHFQSRSTNKFVFVYDNPTTTFAVASKTVRFLPVHEIIT